MSTSRRRPILATLATFSFTAVATVVLAEMLKQRQLKIVDFNESVFSNLQLSSLQNTFVMNGDEEEHALALDESIDIDVSAYTATNSMEFSTQFEDEEQAVIVSEVSEFTNQHLSRESEDSNQSMHSESVSSQPHQGHSVSSNTVSSETATESGSGLHGHGTLLALSALTAGGLVAAVGGGGGGSGGDSTSTSSGVTPGPGFPVAATGNIDNLKSSTHGTLAGISQQLVLSDNASAHQAHALDPHAYYRDSDFSKGRLEIGYSNTHTDADHLRVQIKNDFLSTGDTITAEIKNARGVWEEQTIATITQDGTGGQALVIDFTEHANEQLVQSVLQSVVYYTSAGAPYTERTVYIEIDDGHGNVLAKEIDVYITDAPHSIQLDTSTFDSNTEVNDVIGTFGNARDTANAQHTDYKLALINDAQGRFALDGNELLLKDETVGVYNDVVAIEITDPSSGLSQIRSFGIIDERVSEFDDYQAIVNYEATLNDQQKTDFASALEKWESSFTEGLDTFSHPLIGSVNDLKIDVMVKDIDGPGGILAYSGGTLHRPHSKIPVAGEITLDGNDLDNTQLSTIVTHELGHVLGFDNHTWSQLGLFDQTNYLFTGVEATAAFNDLFNFHAAPRLLTGVPVERDGGAGTAGSHWAESIFANELMTGWLDPNDATTPLSIVTLAALSDIGYSVDLNQADDIGFDHTDTDGDGLIDVLETRLGYDLNYHHASNGAHHINPANTALIDQVDSDNDGISDFDEFYFTFTTAASKDVDNDGIFNWRDEDSNGNNILDGDEGLTDHDGDGIVNFLDTHGQNALQGASLSEFSSLSGYSISLENYGYIHSDEIAELFERETSELDII